MNAFWQSLTGQLLSILLGMTLIFAAMWLLLVRKRKHLMWQLERAGKDLIEAARRAGSSDQDRDQARPRSLREIVNDPKFSGLEELERYNMIASQLPEWLRTLSDRTRLDPRHRDRLVDRIEIGRGGLLMALVGSVIACIGVLLTTSNLQLFNLLRHRSPFLLR